MIGEIAGVPQDRILEADICVIGGWPFGLDDRDAFGLRRAHLPWSLGEIDKHTMRVAPELYDAELRRLGLGELKTAPWLAAAPS